MTRSELKSIIKECMNELESDNQVIGEAAFDEDQVALEQAEFVCEACFVALDEMADKATREKMADDAVAAFADKKNALKDAKKAQKEIAKSIADANKNSADPDKVKESALKKVAAQLGGGFKVVGGKIVSTYSGKDGKGKQVAAIAVTATAIAGAIAAAAMLIIKKNKKEEAKEDEQQKDAE